MQCLRIGSMMRVNATNAEGKGHGEGSSYIMQLGMILGAAFTSMGLVGASHLPDAMFPSVWQGIAGPNPARRHECQRIQMAE